MVTHNGLIPHDNKITNNGVQESLESSTLLLGTFC